MQDGRDTSIVLRLFKTACLSYAPTDVSYRDHKMSRAQLLQMRKDLIDKVNGFMHQSGLHKEGAIYPRRYFDDLIMEQHMAAQQSGIEQLLMN
jgi:deoxyxylulose-5-phosphate synthase